MKLFYIKDNFGDRLNPIIFNHYLPNFFDNNPDEVFMGIGSVLGFQIKETRKKIVFSSGFAAGNPSVYGTIPKIDSNFEIICVRGPLTAKALGLPNESAVTDGAALLKFFDFPPLEKKYQISFMPHISSEAIYDWEEMCKEIGFNYISPQEDPMKIITQIRQSELMIAEAMHSAIVADVFKVPWIPVKGYKSINDFKWCDWLASLEMEYKPTYIKPILRDEFIQQKIESLLSIFPQFIKNLLVLIYRSWQNVFFKPLVIKDFAYLCKAKSYLSNRNILNEKANELKQRLHQFKFSQK